MKKSILIVAALGLLSTINKTHTMPEVKEAKEGAEDIDKVKRDFLEHLKELQALNEKHNMKHNELLKRGQNVIELLKVLPVTEDRKEWLPAMKRLADKWQEDDQYFYKKMQDFWGKHKGLEAKAKSMLKQTPLSFDDIYKLYQEFNNQFENEYELEEDAIAKSDELLDKERDVMIKELSKGKPKEEVEVWTQYKDAGYDREHDKLIKDQGKMKTQILDELVKLENMVGDEAAAAPVAP